MDIEEFLDRELSELGITTEKSKAPEIGAEFLKEDFEPASLFESIKANLSKENIDEAELQYVKLWRALAEQNLKWDRELYWQLSDVSRQFSSALGKAYENTKKKADYIYDLIKKGRAALKEGKKELPYKIYAEIENINISIPNVFFEERKIIQEQIAIFYEELRNTTDNELIKRVSALVNDINNLVDRINISIRANNVADAEANYGKAVELYNRVPEGFLRHKISLGLKLLDIYKSLSIYTEILSLQKQMQSAAPNLSIATAPLQASALMSHSTKTLLLHSKKERAKKNMEKGFLNEAIRDIEEVLQLEPNDTEAKVIKAKIKTLQ